MIVVNLLTCSDIEIVRGLMFQYQIQTADSESYIRKLKCHGHFIDISRRFNSKINDHLPAGTRVLHEGSKYN